MDGASTPDFDRVAGLYRWLEHAAFGRALQRARLAQFAHLPQDGRVLAIGDGDGRAVKEVLRRHPGSDVRAIDVSARMISVARARLTADERGRATFERADARRAAYPPGAYDAVLTFFSLDCLTVGDAEALIDRVLPSLAPGGVWLWADFQIPSSGWRRLHAQLWVGGLYRAFGLLTRLEVTTLPPVPAQFDAAGLREIARTDSRAGLLTSRVFTRRV